MKVLYLAHMLGDAAVRKRTAMLQGAGANVLVMGFERGGHRVVSNAGVETTSLGETSDAALVKRVGNVILAIPKLWKHRSRIQDVDVILARSLEMAVLGLFVHAFISRRTALVYESLDIHRLLLRKDAIGSIMRAIEGAILKRSKLVIVSSPSFIANYFSRYFKKNPPFLLVENKILDPEDLLRRLDRKLDLGPSRRWRIGWFGIIRCAKSLAILDRLTRKLGGRVELVIRGKPAYHEFDDFDAIVAANPYIRFEGAYSSPDDLDRIYSEVHFTWAIDYFEEGANSSWLLPNRLYEGGYYGAVPIALEYVETGKWLARQDVGLVVSDDVGAALEAFFNNADCGDQWAGKRKAMYFADPSLWLCGSAECGAFGQKLKSLTPAAS